MYRPSAEIPVRIAVHFLRIFGSCAAFISGATPNACLFVYSLTHWVDREAFNFSSFELFMFFHRYRQILERHFRFAYWFLIHLSRASSRSSHPRPLIAAAVRHIQVWSIHRLTFLSEIHRILYFVPLHAPRFAEC